MNVTTAQGFSVSLLCAVALFVCLFSNINKDRTWGRTIWGSAACYGITGFLFLLNPYTVVELYPVRCFGLTTLVMLSLAGVSYIKNANSKLELASAGDRLAMLESRQRTFNTLGVGTGWIIIVTSLIVVYGVADQTAPLDFGKQLARMEQKIDRSEVTSRTQYNELIKNGQKRDKRLDNLEATDRQKAQHDNALFASLAAGQRYIVSLFRSANKAKPDRPLLITVPQAKTLPSSQFVMPGEERVKPVQPVNKRGKKISYAPAPWLPDTTELARLWPVYIPN